MIDIESNLNNFPTISLAAGDFLLHQGEKTDSIYFLRSGKVEVFKDDIGVAIVDKKGAVFGELSIMLDTEHTASVCALENTDFYKIEHPQKYLLNHPEIIWHIAQILGVRLTNMNQYLVDVKRQYEGHDHLHMIDEVLEALHNTQKTAVSKRSHSDRKNPGY